jgi:bifunctional enzyme CysN/CysC
MVVMTAFISPFKREREMARSLIGDGQFIEVYVNTSIETCEQRDVKGLYKQARAGKIPNMTGINSPYEAPDSAEYEADTATKSVGAIIQDLAQVISKF